MVLYIVLVLGGLVLGHLSAKASAKRLKKHSEEERRELQRQFQAQKEQLEAELSMLRSSNRELTSIKEKAERLAAKHKDTVVERNKLHFDLHQAKIEVEMHKEYRRMLTAFYASPAKFLDDERRRLEEQEEEDRIKRENSTSTTGVSVVDVIGGTVVAGAVFDSIEPTVGFDC